MSTMVHPQLINITSIEIKRNKRGMHTVKLFSTDPDGKIHEIKAKDVMLDNIDVIQKCEPGITSKSQHTMNMNIELSKIQVDDPMTFKIKELD